MAQSVLKKRYKVFISLEIYNFGWLLVIGGLFFCCSSPESGRGKAKDQNGGRGIGRYVHLHHAHSHDLTFGAQCSEVEPLQTQRFAQNLSCARFQFLKDKIDQNTNFDKLPHLFLVYKN